MKRNYSIVKGCTLGLAVLSLFFIIFNVIQVNTRLEEVIFNYGSAYTVGIGYIFILLFHFFALFFLLVRIRRSKAVKPFVILVIALGIASLFMIAVEKVLFDEIGREYRMGVEYEGEVLGLCFAFFINAVYAVAVLATGIGRRTADGAQPEEKDLKDENIFTAAQYMGVVSGLGGLYLTFSLMARQIPADRLWIYLPFYALFLAPYGLSVLYWLFLKRREKNAGWYDEKQFQDILKSSLVTLILSVPGMALFMLFSLPASVYWFLYYFFFVLLVFSGGILYFFRMKDSG